MDGGHLMWTIEKHFTFSASHRLQGLPPGHQCARMHGHNIIVAVTLSSDRLDDVGFVKDYGDLKPLGHWLDAQFDHRHLNDAVDFNPTAELMAQHIYEWCEAQGWPVSRVGWSETPKTWAYFERGTGDAR
jgi:6-pyruvoyltetrahydropterin/6-carboxytetrahydropterin synthase